MEMKKLFLLVLILQVQYCLVVPAFAGNLDTMPISVDDVDVVMKKGKNLFEGAHYEEASREFLAIARLDTAPQEDRIKARYFLMKIYRAYGEDEKVKNEIREIFKLSPGYIPSSREPASVKKLFGEIREEFLKEQLREETAPSSVIKENLVILERSLAEVSSSNESFGLKVEGIEKELKKIKLSFWITSTTLLLLLIAGIGFK